MKIDPQYRASTNFYACHPRPIYEQPIKAFLFNNGMPHRQSGPLNIAKATEGINSTWASNRDDQEVAQLVLSTIKYLEDPKRTTTELTQFLVDLLRRFYKLRKKIEQLHIEVTPETDPSFLFNLSKSLIQKTPDKGNTPQKIIGFLLKNYYDVLGSNLHVSGYADSASVTNTTSKKPGDIIEETHTGKIHKVYEITVKKFDIQRIADSFQSLEAYNIENGTSIREIIVICRKEDCPDNLTSSNTSLCMGCYEYSNVQYYFWDIFEWINLMIHQMNDEGRQKFHSELAGYVNNINTSETVKVLWAKLHKSETGI